MHCFSTDSVSYWGSYFKYRKSCVRAFASFCAIAAAGSRCCVRLGACVQGAAGVCVLGSAGAVAAGAAGKAGKVIFLCGVFASTPTFNTSRKLAC